MIELPEIVRDFAVALKFVDSTAPQGRSKTRVYRPGVGPLTEEAAVDAAVAHLKQTKPDVYSGAGPLKLCDLVLPNQWAIEFKLIRPFGDNGKPAEHWSENILHPYPGNVSSLGDCVKLKSFQMCPRKAVVAFGYEHTPAALKLEIAVRAFECIARDVLGVTLGPRHEASATGLMHPVHQQLRGLWLGGSVDPHSYGKLGQLYT